MAHPLITASGAYDLTMEEYRGQPADGLSLASSDAMVLIESTPAHLKASWEESDEGSKEADIGSLIHALILEPTRKDKLISVIDADSFQTKAARQARDDARASGRIPILPKHLEQAEGAVKAVWNHPLAASLLDSGKAEQSWFAKDPATGLYRKARTDFFNSRRIIVDLKTTASAAPAFIQRRVFDGYWFTQSPWHCQVVEQVQGKPAAGYCWVIVEQKPPHCVVVRKPTDTVLMHGHRLNEKAWETFVRCAKTGQWPGYAENIEDLTLPSFALFKLEEEGVADESTPKRGMEALAWAEASGAHVFS